MKLKTYDTIKENLYTEKLPNGLQVYMLPKQEMTKTFAIFMTNYGSIDRSFTPIGEKETITVPDGIAHFLEHKLFEKEDRDVFNDFLQQGASPNAFTSFTKTAYLFSTTQHTEENVETLLDFVQEPYFSDQSVEKEKGIIGQEIKMYDDQPDWQAFMGTIRNLFERHPVRIDIAGTVDSIDEITKEHLYTCYNTFYHPKNMVLFLIGNIDQESMMEKIKENQTQKDFASLSNLDRAYPEEREKVFKKETTLHMPVSIPKVTVGIKEASSKLDQKTFLEKEVLQSMLLDYLFSPSGTYYEKLYNEELIDDSFEFSTTVEESFSYSLLSTNTENPKKTSEELKKALLSTKSLQLSEEILERMKKKRIGQLLRGMNSMEFTANEFAHYHFMGIDFFEVIPYIQSITLERVNTFLQHWIEEDRLTVCKIESET